MVRRRALLLLTMALVVFAALAVFGGTAAATSHDVVDECAAEPLEDFDDPEDGNETIGWFDGYWYNEPIDIEGEDGISPEELDELSKRAAARMEAMRCLTFDYIPPVEIIERDEYADELSEGYEVISEEARQFDNAQLEAMMLVDSETDSVDLREGDQTVSVGGFYDFNDERIVVITDDPDALLIDEPILAHELGHALQDQHFDIGQYERPTADINSGVLGVIEGDASWIESQYAEACDVAADEDEEGGWSDPCVAPETDPEEGSDDLGSWGQWAFDFQPYSDGPAFIASVHEEGGWDAVNTLYSDMPTTARHTIDPESYGEFQPTNVTIEEEIPSEWEQVTIVGEPNYNVIGQAGLVGMLVDPALTDSQGGESVDNPPIEVTEFIDATPPSLYNYAHPETSGWQGDRFEVFSNGDDEAAFWKLSWESEQDVEEFVAGYERLIEIRGGESHDEADHLWTFSIESDYHISIAVIPNGTETTILTGPTLDDLEDIHSNVTVPEEPPEDDGSPGTPGDDQGPSDDGSDDGPTDDGTDDGDGSADDDTDDDDSEDSIPGFGVLAAIGAAIATSLYLRRRRPNDTDRWY